jgi:hypothetical protein
MNKLISATAFVFSLTAGTAMAAVGNGEYGHQSMEGNVNNSTFDTTVLEATALNIRSEEDFKSEKSASVPAFWGEFEARGSQF